MGETALVVTVPEAEPAIELLRRRHTTSGAEGMPPHVTLIYPFTDGDQLTAGRVNEAAEVVSRIQAFEYRLVRTARFEDALLQPFPNHPPYGDADFQPVPHVTVAIGGGAELDEIESQVEPWLPIAARAEAVSLMERGPSREWRLRQELPLAK